MLILESARRKSHEEKRWLALIYKDVDIDEGVGEETEHGGMSAFEHTKMLAEAAKRGQTEQEFVFDLVGIDVEIDDELRELQKLEQELK